MIHNDIILFSYSYYNDTRSFIRTLSYSNDTRGTSRIIFDISNKWNQCTCIERFMETWLCTVTLSNVSAQLGRCAGAQCARKSVDTSPGQAATSYHGPDPPSAWPSNPGVMAGHTPPPGAISHFLKFFISLSALTSWLFNQTSFSFENYLGTSWLMALHHSFYGNGWL